MRLLVALCILGAVLAEDETPEVNPPTGRIRGSVTNSRGGRKIFSFRGIRYAEPPVGQQRFQIATPAADWKDVFDATEEGPGCPAFRAKNISEDCLRLNVYSTRLPSLGTKHAVVKRPVLVFFHPGAFYAFSGQSFLWGPEYLMDKNIVLVTVNYRMGSLGFLSTGDSLAPGNLGLKDQVLALRWVQRNIAAFGGDPDSVTISGYSIGSVSVMLHTISPMSRGLFHRGICMSGAFMALEAFPTDQKHLAKKQAELLGCPTDTTGSMLICLNTKPVENFTNTLQNFFEWYGDPILIWKPVVELHGGERFLTDQPINLIRQGKFHQVPLIIGSTEDELGGVVTLFDKLHKSGNDSVFDDMNNNWETVAPIAFLYERETPKSRQISQEVRKFYFGDQPVSPDTYEGLANVYSDSILQFPVHRGAKLFAANSRLPVFFYKFTYRGRYSFVRWNETTTYGVVHHDDLQYLFFIKDMFPFFKPNDPEIPMVEKMTSMWSQFVITGDPIPSNHEFRNVTWERFSPSKDNYLDINLSPTMKTGFFPERMRFWERLFPLNVGPIRQNVKH